MVPMVMVVCNSAAQVDEAVLVSLSFQFGKLCNGLAGETKHYLYIYFTLNLHGHNRGCMQIDVQAPHELKMNVLINNLSSFSKSRTSIDTLKQWSPTPKTKKYKVHRLH